METDAPTTLRLRALFDDYFVVVVVGAVVVAGVGGVLTWQGYAAEDTRTETRTVGEWESVGRFDHQATVVNGTGPFETGEVLRNRSVYFTRLTPVLDGTFVYSYDASDGGDLDVDTRVVAVARSVAEDDPGENATVYWRTERVLNDRVQSLSPGETARMPFSWNVTAAANRAEGTEDRIGGTPGETEVFLRVEVRLSGTRNGRPVDATRTYRLPVEFQQGVYRVDDPGRVTDGDTRTAQVTVDLPPGPLPRHGGPLLTVVGIGSVVVLGLLRRAGEIRVGADEREHLDYLDTREAYDDWITSLSDGVTTEGDIVTVDSLQGLVDLAIDTDARVLEDPSQGQYIVRHDGVCYVYEPPRRPDGPAPDADSRPGPDRGPEPEPTGGTDPDPDPKAETDGDGDENEDEDED